MQEVSKNSDVLAIDLATVAPTEEAKLYCCSLSQSTLKQQLSGLLNFDSGRQTGVLLPACRRREITSA